MQADFEKFKISKKMRTAVFYSGAQGGQAEGGASPSAGTSAISPASRAHSKINTITVFMAGSLLAGVVLTISYHTAQENGRKIT